MSFKLQAERIVEWPVKAFEEVDNELQERVFHVRFKLVELEEGTEATQADVVRDAIVGWGGINDELGQPIPFSAEVRDRLLRRRDTAVGLFTAYAEAAIGAKRKN